MSQHGPSIHVPEPPDASLFDASSGAPEVWGACGPIVRGESARPTHRVRHSPDLLFFIGPSEPRDSWLPEALTY
jgi:hypothetical protein